MPIALRERPRQGDSNCDQREKRLSESTPTKRHAKNGVTEIQIAISIYIVMTRSLRIQMEDIFAKSSQAVIRHMPSEMVMVGTSIKSHGEQA
jgi:hypothetical protein